MEERSQSKTGRLSVVAASTSLFLPAILWMVFSSLLMNDIVQFDLGYLVVCILIYISLAFTGLIQGIRARHTHLGRIGIAISLLAFIVPGLLFSVL